MLRLLLIFCKAVKLKKLSKREPSSSKIFESYISQLVDVQNKLTLNPENAELLKTQTEMDALLKSTRQKFTETEEQTVTT